MNAKKLFVAELTEMLPVPMRLSIPSLNELEICIPRVEKRITDVTYGWVRSLLIRFVPGLSLIRTYLIPSTAAYHIVYGCGYGMSLD